MTRRRMVKQRLPQRDIRKNWLMEKDHDSGDDWVPSQPSQASQEDSQPSSEFTSPPQSDRKPPVSSSLRPLEEYDLQYLTPEAARALEAEVLLDAEELKEPERDYEAARQRELEAAEAGAPDLYLFKWPWGCREGRTGSTGMGILLGGGRRAEIESSMRVRRADPPARRVVTGGA